MGEVTKMGGLQQVFDELVAAGQNPFAANDPPQAVDLGFWWNAPQPPNHNPAMGGMFNDVPLAEWQAGGQPQPTQAETAMRAVVKKPNPPKKGAGG